MSLDNEAVVLRHACLNFTVPLTTPPALKTSKMETNATGQVAPLQLCERIALSGHRTDDVTFNTAIRSMMGSSVQAYEGPVWVE